MADRPLRITRCSTADGAIEVEVAVDAPVVFAPHVVLEAGAARHDSWQQRRIGWLPRGAYRFRWEHAGLHEAVRATLLCREGFDERAVDTATAPAGSRAADAAPFWRIDARPPAPPLDALSWSKGHADWFFRHFDHAGPTVVDYLLGSHPLQRGRILDVGCGDGITDLSIALRTRCTELVGIDPFKGYERLPAILRENHLPADVLPGNLRFLPADANHLPFPDNSFEVVISWGSLEHIAGGYLQALREIKRVLVPDGLLMAHPGLYYGSLGNHLGEFCRDPYFHLKLPPEEVRRIVLETPPDRMDRSGHIAEPAEYWQWYTELNPITISRFEQELRALEFEPWRVCIRTEDLFEYTPELQRFPMQDLASAELYVSCFSRKNTGQPGRAKPAP